MNVLLIDDHPVFQSGLIGLLQNLPQIKHIEVAEKADEALMIAKSMQFDIFFLDVGLPDMDGADLAKILKEKYPGTYIIVLTMHDEPSYIKQMLALKVNAYLSKNASNEEITRAIENLQQGQIFLSSRVQEIVAQTYHETESVDHTVPRLTRREKEILQLIADELTTQEIAKKLIISENTVETHRSNLISKFGVRNSSGLIRKAFKLEFLK